RGGSPRWRDSRSWKPDPTKLHGERAPEEQEGHRAGGEERTEGRLELQDLPFPAPAPPINEDGHEDHAPGHRAGEQAEETGLPAEEGADQRQELGVPQAQGIAPRQEIPGVPEEPDGAVAAEDADDEVGGRPLTEEDAEGEEHRDARQGDGVGD